MADNKVRRYQLTLQCLQTARRITVEVALGEDDLWPEELDRGLAAIKRWCEGIPPDELTDDDMVELAYMMLQDRRQREAAPEEASPA